MSKNVQIITVSAVTLALTIVLGALPIVFLVPLLFTCVTRDWKMSLVASLFFGVVSYLYSYMGSSIIAVAFLENPWIPIVPRLFVGLITHAVYVFMRKAIKGNSKLHRALPISVATTVGSITNTALVVACLMLFANDTTFGAVTMPLYVATMLISGAIELVVTNIVVLPLALTVGKALKLKDYYKPAPKLNIAVSSTEN